MSPFHRDQLPVPQLDAIQWAPSNGVHVSPPSSKANSTASSKPGSTSQLSVHLSPTADTQSAPAILPDPSSSARGEFGQPELITSDEEWSPPPHYTPTYLDRAIQTSPPPSSLPHPSLNVTQDPYPHLNPYPVAYQYSQHPYPYPHPMPWLLPRPFLFPAVPVHTSHFRGMGGSVSEAAQRGHQDAGANSGAGSGISTGIPATSYPFYSYYSYSHPPQVNLHRPIGFSRQPRDISPLIAPLPLLPLPSPTSFQLASEPSSPIIQLNPSLTTASTSVSSVTSPSTSLVPGRSMSTPPSLRPASPIENPFHSLYKSLRSLLLLSEPDPRFLAREMTGEQLVNVHGVGIWSYNNNTPAAVEAAKQTAFKTHGSYVAWLRAARARTAQYAVPGAVRPPLRWVLVEGGGSKPVRPNEQGPSRRHKRKKGRILLPDDALQTGTEANGEKLYCARAWWEGGVHLGKAAAHLQGGGASISYGSLEHSLSTFEILVGDKQYAKWVDVPKGAVLNFPPSSEVEQPSSPSTPRISASGSSAKPITESNPTTPRPALPASFTPIEGGREASGEPLFVAQAEYERGWHPGKARLGEGYCCIAYGGGELWVKGFRVLGYIV